MNIHRNLSLADLFTLLNASLGLSAAMLAMRGDVETALRLVLVAGVADGMDGLVARRRNSSAFGENLDSLADAVTFCVVPALLISESLVGEAVGIVFLLAGLLRLARFNVSGMEEDFFEGLPSTGAGLMLVVFLMVGVPAGVVPVAAVVLSLLMLSTLPYWKPRGPPAVPLGLVLALAAALPAALNGALPALLLGLLLAYGVSGPVSTLRRSSDG